MTTPLLLDITRTYESLSGGPARRILRCARSPGVHAVTVFRFGQWSRRLPLLLRVIFDPVYVLASGCVQFMWGIELPRSASIGSGLCIGHFGGITISHKAIIGTNCNISPGVTIGVSGKGDTRGVPVIGDHVYIGPGAKVFGKITIGNHVNIGANAIVYTNIPDHSTVVLYPGYRIISRGEEALPEMEAEIGVAEGVRK